MADFEKQDKAEEEQRLMEGVAVLDFDLLCSTVALQTQGKWGKLQNGDDLGGEGEIGEFGGVFRMWEGEVFPDCFEDRRIALESACCPCYRFGKNMKRAGFGSCFLQGFVYFILALSAFLSLIAFVVTKQHCFLYVSAALSISIGIYLGFFRSKIKRKFNIKGMDSFLDDWIFHIFCSCCALSQESRTLEMNNVHDGTWHSRADTICIGSYTKGSEAFIELHPSVVPTKSPDHCIMEKGSNGSNNV